MAGCNHYYCSFLAGEFYAEAGMVSADRVSVNYRFAPELKEALEQAAKADGRSVNNYVERLLTEALTERGYLKGDGKLGKRPAKG